MLFALLSVFKRDCLEAGFSVSRYFEGSLLLWCVTKTIVLLMTYLFSQTLFIEFYLFILYRKCYFKIVYCNVFF